MIHKQQAIKEKHIEVRDYNVMIDGKNFFDQTEKNNEINMETLENLLLVKKMIIQLVVY